MAGSPVEGGHMLMRTDPKTAGRKAFETRCGSCHNFSAQKDDFFESWTNGKSASDLGSFASEEWVRGILKNSLDDKYLGLVKISEKGEDGKDKRVHALDGMKEWRRRNRGETQG